MGNESLGNCGMPNLEANAHGAFASMREPVGRSGHAAASFRRCEERYIIYRKWADGTRPNTQVCSWCFCSSWPQLRVVGASRELPADFARFFRALGHRVRSYRMERKLSQEDMISYGFSVRHWQMLEAGRPSTLFTMLRVCDAFQISPEELVAGLGRHLRKRKKEG